MSRDVKEAESTANMREMWNHTPETARIGSTKQGGKGARLAMLVWMG